MLTRNRAFLAPWDPIREDAYFTAEGQRTLLAQALRRHEQGIDWPGVITVDDEPVGRVNLNNVVLGAFCSADLGYWVDEAHNGRGIATAAVAAVVRIAFTELGLHRVQAGTLLHNLGSQRVLERNGFTPIGVAPRYSRSPANGRTTCCSSASPMTPHPPDRVQNSSRARISTGF